MTLKQLGKRFKLQRRAMKLTLQQVADQIPGMTAHNLSAIEKGKVNLTFEKLTNVCEVLKLAPAVLRLDDVGYETL